MERRRNNGLRKRCRCPRSQWPKCSHPWHLNFKWRGVHYRVSLDRAVGKPLASKTDAQAAADTVRSQIRGGTFGTDTRVADRLTFSAFAETWTKRVGSQLVEAPLNECRLKLIKAFVVPGIMPPTTLGDLPVDRVTTDHVEAFREARKAAGKSAATINHDLKLLRKMFAWGIRKGYVDRTPFKIGTEPAIKLEREIPRNRRFEADDDEERLLNAANPHLRAVIIAMLDTGCRPGEILSLQWRDVSLDRKEITIRAEKERTRRQRIIPISSRLAAVLEMRRLDPAGREFGPEAYVFGNSVGERVKTVRTAWINAAEAAGLVGFQLRDLRHEAGSRFDEAGMPINYVSQMLGHSSLTTTSRYLNVHRRGLHMAMERFEKSRAADEASAADDKAAETRADEAVAQTLHTDAPAASHTSTDLEQTSAAILPVF